MKRQMWLLLLVVTLPWSSLFAADGAIPIWESTTITESGSYIVTRDFSGTVGGTFFAINIEANDVNIDLNGFTLRGGDPVVMATDVQRIRLHNGTISAYENAIMFINVAGFAIHDLIIVGFEDDRMIELSGAQGVFERNIAAGEAPYTLHVSGNQMVVRENNVESFNFLGEGGDISLVDCNACRVLHNTANSINAGITGGTVANNTVLKALTVTGSDNLVRDNGVSHGTGVAISGDRNHIEGNLFTANSSFGLKITGSDSVFRRNTVRGNSGTGCTGTASGGDFCDEGTNNTSHGDNYMPGQM